MARSAEPVAVSEPAAIRRAIRKAFDEECATVADAADAVSTGWDGDSTTDRTQVVDRLADRLRADGTASRLVEIAPLVATTLDTALPAEPVAEPPYYVVTGRGPLLRVSLPDRGVRVVVGLVVFEVEAGEATPRYRRTEEPIRIDVSLEPID